MRKNQRNDSSLESARLRNNQFSQRMNQGRDRDFDTDAELYENEEYFKNESRQRPRSDYDYEQMDRPSYERDTAGRRDYSSERSWSSQAEGLHAGKGPKGYQRSEERIREDVCDALEAHAHIDASEVEVEISEGIVTLTGSVESRQAKRLAEQAVETVRGVKDIHNQLQIMSAQDRSRETKSFNPSKNTKSGKKSSANYKQ